MREDEYKDRDILIIDVIRYKDALKSIKQVALSNKKSTNKAILEIINKLGL